MKQKQKKTKKLGLKRHQERRLSTRIAPRSLHILERHGDFEFKPKIFNISTGGIFLLGRVMSGLQESELHFLPPTSEKFVIKAQMIRDQKTKLGFGVAYKFVNVSKEQQKLLRSFLRNL